MIVKEFTGAGGAFSVMVKCYPPSPTVWVWISFAWECSEKGHTPMEFRDSRTVRNYLVGLCESLKKRNVELGAVQDFRVDMVRVLNDVDADFAKLTEEGGAK